MEVANKMGVLAAVAASIAGTETNIDHVSLVERDVDTSTLIFELQVRNRKHLARVMRTIRNDARRTAGSPYDCLDFTLHACTTDTLASRWGQGLSGTP